MVCTHYTKLTLHLALVAARNPANVMTQRCAFHALRPTSVRE